MIIGGIIINYIGATVRWIYGAIWRTLFNKPKFTFNEYIHGPKNSDDYFDEMGHQFNNKIIGVIFIGILFSLLV
ncbi:hypothetical protein [Psychroserpens sp.]